MIGVVVVPFLGVWWPLTLGVVTLNLFAVVKTARLLESESHNELLHLAVTLSAHRMTLDQLLFLGDNAALPCDDLQGLYDDCSKDLMTQEVFRERLRRHGF